MNGRLYRSAWLLVVPPLLLLAFSVARPTALQAPALPPAFDAAAAGQLASDFQLTYPDRIPGTPDARAAAAWFRSQLQPYGLRVWADRFSATIHGRQTTLVNLVAEKAGLSPRAIVIVAHRDDPGADSGLNDNASGTATLVEIARAYGPSGTTRQSSLPYSLVFLSTDGAAEGALGAARFARATRTLQDVVAVVNLDSIGGTSSPRILFNGDTARSAAPGLVETIRAALERQLGVGPARPSGLQQLLDLAFPFSTYEQAPFVSRGVPAVTITTAGARPPLTAHSQAGRLDLRHLGAAGLATEDTIDALEQGVSLSSGPASYVFLGRRLVRGWAIEIVLVAMLLPFLAAAVDLFARCRRRRIRVAPALRSYRSRLGFWAWVGVLFTVFGALGAWGDGGGRPPSLAGVAWPASALLAVGALAGLGWLVARDRLVPRRPVRPEELLAGHTGALLALGVVGLLVAATNPFALLFLLPSLHLWLWLPQVQSRPAPARAAVLLAGFAGPAFLVWRFATRYSLGWDAPWYIARLFVTGYAPRSLLVIALVWLAVAGQLAALAAGRYAPYPGRRDRPRRGPAREVARALFLAQRRRATSGDARRIAGE